MNLRSMMAGFVLIYILFGISAFAGIGMGLDFKGGLNFSNIRGNDVNVVEKRGADIKMNVGVNGGIGLGIDFNNYFSIQPEVIFTMKGYASETGEIVILGISSVDSKIILNYLDIPILFKINIPTGVVIPNFYIGPSLGIFLNAQSRGKIQFTDEMKQLGVEDIDTTSDLTEMYQPVDFGLSMGGGIGIKAGIGRFFLDIRYTLGFLNIRESTKYQLFGTDLIEGEVKNGSLSFILGYRIDFGI